MTKKCFKKILLNFCLLTNIWETRAMDNESLVAQPEGEKKFHEKLIVDQECGGPLTLVGLTGDVSNFIAALVIGLNTFFWGKDWIGMTGLISFALLCLIRIVFHNYGFSSKHEFSTIISTLLLIICTGVTLIANAGYSYESIDPTLMNHFAGGVGLLGGYSVDNPSNTTILVSIITGYIGVFCVLLNMFLKTIFGFIYKPATSY